MFVIRFKFFNEGYPCYYEERVPDNWTGQEDAVECGFTAPPSRAKRFESMEEAESQAKELAFFYEGLKRSDLIIEEVK